MSLDPWPQACRLRSRRPCSCVKYQGYHSQVSIDVPEAPSPQANGSRTVDVNGLPCQLIDRGRGEPVILLHGIGGSADEWSKVIPQLSTRFRVLAPDAPGHGLSPGPIGRTDSYDLELYTRFVLGLLDALDIERISVVGMSGGGAIALNLATSKPARVDSLVLVSSAGLGTDVAWSYRLGSVLPKLVRFGLRRSTVASIQSFGRALCFNPESVPVGWAEKRLEIVRTTGVVDAFLATAHATIGWSGQRNNFVHRLHQIKQRTLLLWGRNDPILPVAHAIRAARLIHGSRLHIYENCGHMPIWEYPGDVSVRIGDFIAAPVYSTVD